MGLSRSRLSSSLNAFWSPIHWKTFVTFTLKSMAIVQVEEPVIDLAEGGLGAGRLLPQEEGPIPHHLLETSTGMESQAQIFRVPHHVAAVKHA